MLGLVSKETMLVSTEREKRFSSFEDKVKINLYTELIYL